MSPKCGVVRKAYAPGMHGKKSRRGGSEYGTQLAAKQKLKRTYGVLEQQFRKHFQEASGKKGITGDLLLERLERRLDNVIYRMGIGSSRAQSRQIVAHGWVKVNGHKRTIPSSAVRPGDTVSVRAEKTEKNYLKNISQTLKNKKDIPHWISFDFEKLTGTIVAMPKRSEIGLHIDPQVVVEYYSR
jgi:small subunit ribosomal protein S4